jgi:hypothetical protein
MADSSLFELTAAGRGASIAFGLYHAAVDADRRRVTCIRFNWRGSECR